MPLVFVCLDGQYDQAKGEELGFLYQGHFLSGENQNTKNATWQGRDGFMTIDQTVAKLYSSKYPKMTIAG